jgi:hypothetical protein
MFWTRLTSAGKRWDTVELNPPLIADLALNFHGRNCKIAIVHCQVRY